MARTAEIDRKTAETDIQLSINLDGSGQSDIQTGVGFFDHMLELFAKHAVIAECAVVGINEKEKGQVPVSLIVLKDGANMTSEALEKELK